MYGDIFYYFDCHQIGLTATPVDFVTKSTFRLFDCEGQLPTANYDLEQAVQDGYLTPFEVFEGRAAAPGHRAAYAMAQHQGLQ